MSQTSRVTSRTSRLSSHTSRVSSHTSHVLRQTYLDERDTVLLAERSHELLVHRLVAVIRQDAQ